MCKKKPFDLQEIKRPLQKSMEKIGDIIPSLVEPHFLHKPVVQLAPRPRRPGRPSSGCAQASWKIGSKPGDWSKFPQQKALILVILVDV
jgi:hypothetical protein